jgi:hypothetical protein
MSIRLENVVVIRKVPMTEETCSNLRVLKKRYEDNLETATGKKHELTYPVVIDLSLKELRKCQDVSE